MMQYFSTVILLLAAFQTGYAANNQYVASVDCINTGVNFFLSEDPAKSDLWNETHFDITLYTGNPPQLVKATDFNVTSGEVTLAFTSYTFVAVTAYGPNQRPLLYNIEQPFYAVPTAASPTQGRNYTFGVYCTVPAAYHVNITTNTTDNGHGGSGGDVINPADHVGALLGGLHADNSTTLGDPLTYTLTLKDNTYAALLPINCKYYNPNNEIQNVPFVSDGCPRPFPPDPESYFSTMVQKDATTYVVQFKAFSFETTTHSVLGIDCDIQLCITQNIAACSQPCFNGPTPPTSGTAGTTTATITSVSTSTATTGTETTTRGPSFTTTPRSSTTSAPTTTVTTAKPPQRKKRAIDDSELVEAPGLTDQPTSTTINDRNVFAVRLPGTGPADTPCAQTSTCDTGMMNALYGVVGGLAALVAILVLTLLYLIYIGRRRKPVDSMPLPRGPVFATNGYTA